MADQPPKLDTRLKEVHQTDLTEGRINQDFVDWLKTKGVNYLLILLVALCAYLGWVRWMHHKSNYQAEAWQAYVNAAGLLPSSLEDVATEYDDVGAVAELARLEAASKLMRAVQSGKPLGAATPEPTPENPMPPAPTEVLTAEQRTEYLDRADRLYQEVLKADDQSTGKSLIAVTALTGRAAVAESRGQIDEARTLYEQAAKRAEATYPELAAISRKRAESAASAQAPAELPTQADVQAAAQAARPPQATPVSVEGWIRKMVLPEETDTAG
jgi:tetratricopeptide (TPR) repeat protein